MTVTNTNGVGIRISNAKVELIDVALNGCRACALFTPLNIHGSPSETTVVATRCEFANSLFGAILQNTSATTFKNCVFHDNSDKGLYVRESTIHLHGEATAIHSNGNDGIQATFAGKVVIHLPSHHNTTYNNGDEDRSTINGGTITNVRRLKHTICAEDKQVKHTYTCSILYKKEV